MPSACRYAFSASLNARRSNTLSDFGGMVTYADQPRGGGESEGRILHRGCDYSAPEGYRRTRRHQETNSANGAVLRECASHFQRDADCAVPSGTARDPPVLLRSHIDLPYRAIRKHLGA